MTASVTSCTTDSIADEDISLETFATGDGQVDPDEDVGGGN